ncbi:MAG TPA: phenylalanine--tRNA ligase beta subunit-related protein, partial [Chloroflexota bacterium]
MRRLFVAPEVQSLLRLGVALLEEVVVADPDPALWEEVARLAERLRERYAGWEPGQIPGLEPARALYRAVGEDPTKRRPSSEALLRRLLRGDDLYRVNTLVDVGNWCSVEFLLPISVLDLGQTEGAIVVRRGAPGEAYQAIG